MQNSSFRWDANLRLCFEKHVDGRSVLTTRRHDGPVLVQRALYPEGPEICHVALLHPPSGMAGGDSVTTHVQLHSGAHAVLATPGATRWYKANGHKASQSVYLDVRAGARLEWLPMENIFFEEADAITRTHIALESDACAMGWDMAQLGRVNKASYWTSGNVLTTMDIRVDGQLVWVDQGRIGAQDRCRDQVSSLAGYPVYTTLWCFGPSLPAPVVETLAAQMPWQEEVRAALAVIPYNDTKALYLVRGIGIHLEDVRAVLIQEGLWN